MMITKFVAGLTIKSYETHQGNIEIRSHKKGGC